MLSASSEGFNLFSNMFDFIRVKRAKLSEKITILWHKLTTRLNHNFIEQRKKKVRTNQSFVLHGNLLFQWELIILSQAEANKPREPL